MFGTIVLWILAVIGGLALIILVWTWFSADKEVKKIKKKK